MRLAATALWIAVFSVSPGPAVAKPGPHTADLATPPMTDEAPVAGRRVRQVAPSYEGTEVHKDYPVRLSHPSRQTADAVEQTLHQVRDAQGDLVEYYLDVPSVVCGDNQCEIITVRMAWDPLGRYLRYALPEGGELTKRGHKTFSRADHRKLHQVLSTPDSILKHLDAKDVVSPAELQEGDEVDGVTGATLIQDESAIVTGAVYTCYTLWHWANGATRGIVRDTSGLEMGTGQLMQYLNNGSEDQAVFAMERLADRATHDDETAASILRRVRDGNDQATESGLGYFESMGPEAYYAAIEELFGPASPEKRLLLLKSLTSTDLAPPPGFFNRASVHLADLETYLEVHLLIGLLTYHGIDDADVTAHAARLLDHPSFLVARKASTFLDQQALTADEQEKLDSFKKKFGGRL